MFTLQIDINMAGTKQKAPPPAKPAEPAAANHSNPPILLLTFIWTQDRCQTLLHQAKQHLLLRLKLLQPEPPYPLNTKVPQPEPLYQTHMPKRLRKKHVPGTSRCINSREELLTTVSLQDSLWKVRVEAPWKNPEGSTVEKTRRRSAFLVKKTSRITSSPAKEMHPR